MAANNSTRRNRPQSRSKSRFGGLDSWRAAGSTSQYDLPLLMVVAVLVGLGLVMIFSASYAHANRYADSDRHADGDHYPDPYGHPDRHTHADGDADAHFDAIGHGTTHPHRPRASSGGTHSA